MLIMPIYTLSPFYLNYLKKCQTQKKINIFKKELTG